MRTKKRDESQAEAIPSTGDRYGASVAALAAAKARRAELVASLERVRGGEGEGVDRLRVEGANAAVAVCEAELEQTIASHLYRDDLLLAGVADGDGDAIALHSLGPTLEAEASEIVRLEADAARRRVSMADEVAKARAAADRLEATRRMAGKPAPARPDPLIAEALVAMARGDSRTVVSAETRDRVKIETAQSRLKAAQRDLAKAEGMALANHTARQKRAEEERRWQAQKDAEKADQARAAAASAAAWRKQQDEFAAQKAAAHEHAERLRGLA